MAKQIITLMRLVLSQNYFTFQNKIKKKGVAIGSPISSTIAEIFLQHLEDAHMKQLLDNRNVTFYTRYVDDILVIRYWKNKLWSHHLIHKLNTQRHSTQPHTWNYKLCKLSWFTIVIIRKTANLEIAIYRKPTTTDKTINFFFFKSAYGT